MSYIPPSKRGNASSARSGNAFKSASSYTDKTPVVIAPPETDDLTHSGFYPRIHDQGLNPTQALGNYLETYVERDLR